MRDEITKAIKEARLHTLAWPGTRVSSSVGALARLLEATEKARLEADVSRQTWEEQAIGKHTSPKNCPSWYDWCNCGGELVEQRDRLTKQLANAAEAIDAGVMQVEHAMTQVADHWVESVLHEALDALRNYDGDEFKREVSCNRDTMEPPAGDAGGGDHPLWGPIHDFAIEVGGNPAAHDTARDTLVNKVQDYLRSVGVQPDDLPVCKSMTVYVGTNTVRVTVHRNGDVKLEKLCGPTPEEKLFASKDGAYVSGIVQMWLTRLWKEAGVPFKMEDLG